MVRKSFAAGIPLPNSSVCWFLVSTFASSMGRNGFNMASAWTLVVAGEGSASVAIYFAIVSVTELIGSPVAGWMCDRFSRRLVFVAAETLRFVVGIGLALSLTISDVRWTIWINAIVFAACDRAALTASQSMIPCVGARYTTVTANSAAVFVMQLGSLAAALAMGLLLDGSTSAAGFASTAIAFAVAALGMSFVRGPNHVPSISIDQAVATGPSYSALALSVWAYALLYAGGILVSIVGPAFVFEELTGSAIDFGRFESAWSLGSILGAVIFANTARFATAPHLILIAIALSACSFAAMAMTGLPWALLVVGVLGILYNVGRVAIEVTLQTNVPSGALGRTKGLVHSSAVLLSLALLGIVASCSDLAEPSTLFALWAGVLAIGAMFLMTRHTDSPV